RWSSSYAVRFDPNTDTLICVGDLIDRGENSQEAILFLENPFVFAVRGNHEQMLLDAQESFRHASDFYHNGGQWWHQVSENTKEYILQLAESMPYAIELDTEDGPIGIVHADIPLKMNWPTFL